MDIEKQYEVTTPVGKKKVILKAYSTGRIRQEIENIFLKHSTVLGDGSTSYDAMATNEATNKAIELIVLSVEGAEGSVLDAVLDMHDDDYDFIKGEVNKVTRPLARKKQDESEKATTEPSTEA